MRGGSERVRPANLFPRRKAGASFGARNMKNVRGVASPWVVLVFAILIAAAFLAFVLVGLPLLENQGPSWTSSQISTATLPGSQSTCATHWVNSSAWNDRFCLWSGPYTFTINWTFDHGTPSGKVYGFGCQTFTTCKGTVTWTSGNDTGMIAYTEGSSFVTISANNA